MLISEIKNKDVRDLALLRANQERENFLLPPIDSLDVPLIRAFSWSDSEEGHYFWVAINEGSDLAPPTTIRVQMDMPRLTDGWRYTGEFRKSVKGVDYIYCDGKVVLSRGQALEYPIVTRVSK